MENAGLFPLGGSISAPARCGQLPWCDEWQDRGMRGGTRGGGKTDSWGCGDVKMGEREGLPEEIKPFNICLTGNPTLLQAPG